MCRGCFNPLILHRDFVAGNKDHVFGDSTFSPNQRNFMASSTETAAAPGISKAQARPSAPEGADLIFKGGKIIPIPGATPVNSLAIAGGKVLALGAEADGLITKNTQVIDLNGRVLLPGLIDPHHHTVISALIYQLLTDVGYPKYPTRAKLLDGMRTVAARTPAGQWLLYANFDNILQGGDLSREELDSVSTSHPIFVWYINAHDACVNSLALKVAQIPEDIGQLPGNGRFGRDDKGQLNGLIYEENALKKVLLPALPKITPQIAGKALMDYFHTVAATGNTHLHEPAMLSGEWIPPLAKLSNNLSCRVSASMMIDAMKGIEPYRDLGLGAKAAQVPNSLFYLYGIKIVGDGSNQTRTGAQTQPYLDTQNKGAPNFDAAQLKELVAQVKDMGMPILIHCNGDYTIDIALDAIEAAYGASTAAGINRIEHCTMVRPDQIQRMKKLNVEPSFTMNHVRFYGAAYRDRLFGPQRTSFMDPLGACVASDLNFTLHTDSPCTPPGPLPLISTAVTRRCEIDDSIIGKNLAVTLDRALRAVTIDAAHQVGLGDQIGSLAKGKEADLTILETDPYKVDPEKIAQIKVSETWVAGNQKYSS